MCIRDRGRGAWICDTDQGLKLLLEYKGTVRRLEFEEQVLAYIKDQGFLYVDQYVRNREAVSYTHLDVYKRQEREKPDEDRCEGG